jgi:hypothetical protein
MSIFSLSQIHTQVTLAAERAITLLMRQLVQMAISRRLPAIYAQALPHVLIGMFVQFVSFSSRF